MQKYDFSIKNWYIDKSDNMINKYSSKYYRTIKMKSIDVITNTYIDSVVESNDKDPTFEVSDHV